MVRCTYVVHSSPSAFSLSPCLKNSSCTASAHLLLTLNGRTGLDTSAMCRSMEERRPLVSVLVSSASSKRPMSSKCFIASVLRMSLTILARTVALSSFCMCWKMSHSSLLVVLNSSAAL
jgi:hypothetical protein